MSDDPTHVPEEGPPAASKPGTNRDKPSEKATEELIKPHENDILLGRGGKNNLHIGNEKLRDLARERCGDYRLASKKQKTEISRTLVRMVRAMKPPGRFLRRNSTTGRWEDAGDTVAKEKAGQVLRDALNQYDPTSQLHGGGYIRNEPMPHSQLFNPYGYRSYDTSWQSPRSSRMFPPFVDHRSDSSVSFPAEYNRDPPLLRPHQPFVPEYQRNMNWPPESSDTSGVPSYRPERERKRPPQFEEFQRPAQRRRLDQFGGGFDRLRYSEMNSTQRTAGTDLNLSPRLSELDSTQRLIGAGFDGSRHTNTAPGGFRQSGMDFTSSRQSSLEINTSHRSCVEFNTSRRSSLEFNPSRRSSLEFNDARRMGLGSEMGPNRLGSSMGFNDSRGMRLGSSMGRDFTGSFLDNGSYNDSSFDFSRNRSSNIAPDHRRLNMGMDENNSARGRMGMGVNLSDHRRIRADGDFSRADMPEIPPIPPARMPLQGDSESTGQMFRFEHIHPPSNSFASASTASSALPTDFQSQQAGRSTGQLHFSTGDDGMNMLLRPPQHADRELYTADLLSDQSDDDVRHQTMV